MLVFASVIEVHGAYDPVSEIASNAFSSMSVHLTFCCRQIRKLHRSVLSWNFSLMMNDWLFGYMPITGCIS
jgi:hypothetical protein